MKRIAYILFLMLMPLCAVAGNPAPAVTDGKLELTKKAGDDAYNTGRFADAVEIYEAVIKNDGATKQLYYNLGNAYYRLDNKGKAILNYERALRLDPTDEDTKANLEFVNTQIKDEIIAEPEIFFVTWWNGFINLVAIDTWAVIAVVCFVVSLAGAALFFIGRSRTIRLTGVVVAAVSIVLVIIANFAAYGMYSNVNDDSKAIVLKEEVSLMNAPGASTVLMKVHEGRKVTVTDDSADGWTEVELEDGTVGWLKNEDVERI